MSSLSQNILCKESYQKDLMRLKNLFPDKYEQLIKTAYYNVMHLIFREDVEYIIDTCYYEAPC
jgi:hypothetical protein